MIQEEHKLQRVALIDHVEYINDSKATNINSTWYALETMTRPVILILGGIDKGNDWSQLTELVNEKVKAIILIGRDISKVKSFFAHIGKIRLATKSMNEAVHFAHKLAKSGDAVLLSPGCASFDLFEHYEDRGMRFKAAVRAI